MYNLDYSISLAKAYLGESFFEGLDISFKLDGLGKINF